MTNFSQQKNKLDYIYNNVQDEANNIARLKKITVKFNQDYYNKKLNKITIVNHQRIGSNTIFGKDDPTAYDNYNTYLLEEFPENFISFAKVVPILSLESGFNFDDGAGFSWYFNYYFQELSTNKYLLNTFTNVTRTKLIQSTIQEIPVYLDLYLYLINPLNYR